MKMAPICPCAWLEVPKNILYGTVYAICDKSSGNKFDPAVDVDDVLCNGLQRDIMTTS